MDIHQDVVKACWQRTKNLWVIGYIDSLERVISSSTEQNKKRSQRKGKNVNLERGKKKK